jgi:hypothetical protein
MRGAFEPGFPIESRVSHSSSEGFASKDNPLFEKNVGGCRIIIRKLHDIRATDMEWVSEKDFAYSEAPGERPPPVPNQNFK